jgi:hypothetical protein
MGGGQPEPAGPGVGVPLRCRGPGQRGHPQHPIRPRRCALGQRVQELVDVGPGGRRPGGLDRSQLVAKPAVSASGEPARVLEQPPAGRRVRVQLGDAVGVERRPGTTAQTGSAVPITSHTTPGSTTRRPAWRPSRRRTPAPPGWTRPDPPPRAARRDRPSAVCAGCTAARDAGSIPKASQASADQPPPATSSSIEDEALDGSTASSPDACQATSEPGSRNQRAAACWSSRCSASHAILAATCPDRDCSRSARVAGRGRCASKRRRTGRRLGGPSRSAPAPAAHRMRRSPPDHPAAIRTRWPGSRLPSTARHTSANA